MAVTCIFLSFNYYMQQKYAFKHQPDSIIAGLEEMSHMFNAGSLVGKS